MMVRRTCPVCRCRFSRERSAINRALQSDLALYCGRVCSAAARRTDDRTPAQKRADKAEYDREYRDRKAVVLKAKKAERHRRTYNPKAAAEARKKRMPYHVEYCRRPEYKAKKRTYDRKRYAAEFGEFAECHELLMSIRGEVNARITDYETRTYQGTLNKTQNRRRQWGRASTNLPAGIVRD